MGVLVELICNFNWVLGVIFVVVLYDVLEVMSIVDWVYLLVDGKVIV